LFSRVNVLQTAPDRIADVRRVVRDAVHPGIRGEAGYVGYIVLGDRETGTALGVTLWESEAAREGSNKSEPRPDVGAQLDRVFRLAR